MMIKGGLVALLIAGFGALTYLLWPYKGILLGLVVVTLYSIAAYQAAGARRQ